MREDDKASVFRVGEVCSVQGRTIKVAVDKLKNVSYLIYKGELIKSVSVNGYLKIAKGYTFIIGKIEGEAIDEDKVSDPLRSKPLFKRILIVSLIGYIEGKKFRKGVKELPLMGNEAFLLTNDEFELIHNFASEGEITFSPGCLLSDSNHPITLSAYKLFTSHIGIFGNTGSGKSYTLANIYNRLFSSVDFAESESRFLLFDFNGEYSSSTSIMSDKQVYKLSTHRDVGELKLLPLPDNAIYDIDLLSIISHATEKTQKPFLKRAISFYREVQASEDSLQYFKNIVKDLIVIAFSLTDRLKAETIFSYIKAILKEDLSDKVFEHLDEDYEWHGHNGVFKIVSSTSYFNGKDIKLAATTNIYKATEFIKWHTNDMLTDIVRFLYIRLSYDLYYNRVANEHIAPVINKFKSIQTSFSKVFCLSNIQGNYMNTLFNGRRLCVIDMNSVNVEMKKMIPLLLISKIYREQKSLKQSYLNIIIDEAHNILSDSSDREAESWKDYRLETFEEVIKEGRKFGVFLTIASQRPSDISPTIISQLHNFFIHRLVNEMDLKMMSRSISYLDAVSHEMLPILPTGACVLAGTISEMPVVLQVSALPSEVAPQSQTIDLSRLWRGRQPE